MAPVHRRNLQLLHVQLLHEGNNVRIHHLKNLIVSSLKGKANKAKNIGESVMLLIQSGLIFLVGYVLFLFMGPKGESLNLKNKNVA